MGIKKRIKLKANKRTKLTAELQFAFEIGTDRLGALGHGLTEVEIKAKLRELWEIHREEAMARWFETEEPFTRPAIWWLVDSPTPRPEIVWEGDTPGGDPYAADRALRLAKEISIMVGHGLLTPAEKKLLDKQPGLLLPLESELEIDAREGCKAARETEE